ncbi:Piso0_000606 [Millerozyma farinosa CBS 7064]|uniref:Piso0_000606 protein n=1 Tax=Pichia sorbitophila (strain ATCC MYA-4447 / BCRC 22081 / CBS 7064 / NBRC 10061 / NRRL Y-12695) TaxID=559304 RepID=G8YPJ7_PICSO|nr:Piso0_000606 [Millerozyma farinosa CBS 7064]
MEPLKKNYELIPFFSDIDLKEHFAKDIEFCILDNLAADFLNQVTQQSMSINKIPFSKRSTYLGINLGYKEENMFLRHYLEQVVPIADALSNSPWKKLLLHYCDSNVARSCFIALASIHLHKIGALTSDTYYDKSLFHISNVTEHLLGHISLGFFIDSNQQVINETKCAVILLLGYTYIIFMLIDSGRSTTVRRLFAFFSCMFKEKFQIDNGFPNLYDRELKFLVVLLSWFDTISSIVSPDSRLPHCVPSWFGATDDHVSTIDMMGCPPEIFEILWNICKIKNQIKNGVPREYFENYATKLTSDIMNYRVYVRERNTHNGYIVKLKCAQCWAIATYITLLEVLKPQTSSALIHGLVHEFLDVYKGLNPHTQIVNQIVWPLFVVGYNCITASEREIWLSLIDTLYQVTHTGVIETMRSLIIESWERNVSIETVLKELMVLHIDFLPV